MRQAITTFVTTLLMDLGDTAAPALHAGMSPVGVCRCTIAVSVAVHGNAYAVANPSLPGTAGTGAVGNATPGPTGFVNTVSITANGAAEARSTSGTVGAGDTTPAVDTATASNEIVVDRSMHSGVVSAAVNQLSGQMLTANGAVATTLDIVPCLTGCTTMSHGAVEIAMLPECPGATTCTAANAPDCWASDVSAHGGTWCTIAIAISFSGSAHAGVVVATNPTAVSTVPAVECGAALAGGSTAAAIATYGDAHATAVMGGSPACAAPVPDLMHPAAPSATSASGATGNALGVAIAGSGVANAMSASGNSGPVIAEGGDASGASTTTATTGDTGDAIGIALAKLSAVTQVHSGNSGRAATVCAGCSGATTPNGGDAIAIAASGNTGLSFSLAVAGLQASVNSSSGNSGDSVGIVMDGAIPGVDGRTDATGATTGSPGQVVVSGRSGNTGDTVVVAIGITSWVDVLGYTGTSGPVASTATWGDTGGCSVSFETLKTICPNQQAPGQQARPASAAVAFRNTPLAPAGTALPPPAVAAALVNNKPIQVTTLTATKRSGPDTVRSARDNSTVVTGGEFGVPAAEVSQVVKTAPSSWSLPAQIGIAAVVLSLIVMACRYGRPGKVNSS
jgi:hypothetical protein